MIAMQSVSARLVLGLFGLLLCGCGVSTPTAKTTTGTAESNLAGNWLLFGSLPSAISGFGTPSGLAVSFDVIGSNIVGSAALQTTCSPGSSLGVTLGAVLTGVIASDGSFTLTGPPNSGSATLPTLTVSGVVPSKTGAAWSGTYSFQESDQFCVTSQTAPFTATSVADVAGTFSGSGALVGTPSGNLTLSVTLQQGAPLYSPPGVATVYSRLGLSGSVQIQGFSCFSTGVTGTTISSTVDGNKIVAYFVMDDGSTLNITGSIADTSSSQIQVGFLNVTGGKCNGTHIFGVNPLTLSH